MLTRVWCALALISVLPLCVAAQETGVPAPLPPSRTIEVTGTASRMVPPDVATVVLAVETQGTTVSQAVARNNTAANGVMAAVKGLTIPGLTVRTLSFAVQPLYEQAPPNRPVSEPLRLIGYTVTNRIEAREPQGEAGTLADDVGQVIDTALHAGANRVDDVTFSLANEQPAMLAVLSAATKDAQATAETLAGAAGVTLGRLLTLSATPAYPQPPQPMFARAMQNSDAVPITAGPLTVQATVSAVYEIR